MKKVVFLRVACSPLDAHQTALVLQKTSDGFLRIQGHAPVAWSERQCCWDLFRKAAKRLLGVCEASVVSVCLSEAPHTAVSDLSAVFRQPSHIVSLTLSPLTDEAASTSEQDSERARGTPRSRSRQPCSSGTPMTSPQPKRRAKLSGREMDKLLWQLDDVSQSLERTHSHCEAIARRCEGRTREQRATDGTNSAGAGEDSHVERLLCVAEKLTTQIIHRRQQSRSPTPAVEGLSRQMVMMSEEGAGLPETPTGVCVQQNCRGGAYALWNPLRLDARETNNGCRVTGYAVYVDGVQTAKVNNPIGSHSEITDLENGMQYQIQVSALGEDCESALSLPIPYSHEVHSSATSHPPDPAASSSAVHPPDPAASSSAASSSAVRDQQSRHSAKVENWLRSSQTSCEASSPTNEVHTSQTGKFTKCHDGDIVESDHTPHGSTHLPDDARSVGSSHTSGIVMDHPPSSPKLTPSCPSYRCDGCSMHSETTTLIIDSHSFSNKESSISPYHHHIRFSPSPSPSPSPSFPPSRAHSPASPDHTDDTVIDEPLELSQLSVEREKKSSVSSVQLVAGSRHRGPAPPENVHVRSRQPGYITVSWNPARRDAKGCSSGCFVLGYRVYVNGVSQISMDSPMSREVTVQCPHPNSNHKLVVHVRTRSIAAESVPSSTVVYDTILRESLEQYSGAKVSSSPLSTSTLCPSKQPRPRALRKSPSPARTHAVGQETYV